MANKKDSGGSTIALNKKAKFEYAIEERFEAGIQLLGWEVKALRDGKLNFGDSYALLKNGEAFLFGATITPLNTVSTHLIPEPMRTRKLLLKRGQIDELIGAVERKGYTVVPTALYWKNGKVKVEVGLAKGKQLHDKRATEKERDWNRDKQRVMRRG
jgi:SsrA-binding protein